MGISLACETAVLPALFRVFRVENFCLTLNTLDLSFVEFTVE